MDEYIDIVTETGEPTGKKALKSEIHQKGLYHNTVHVWYYTQAGDILLQQRSIKKSIYPLLWDVSVAGHIDAGESIVRAAKRETLEEIGYDVQENDLDKIGVFQCFQSYQNGIQDNEFHHTFISKIKVDLHLLTPQINEVEALKFVTFGEFIQLLQNSNSNSHFIASNTSYYIFVLDSIRNAVKN